MGFKALFHYQDATKAPLKVFSIKAFTSGDRYASTALRYCGFFSVPLRAAMTFT